MSEEGIPMRRRLGRIALLTTCAGIVALACSAPARAQATTCSASFHVLHDDRIGNLELPRGLYGLATTNLTCARASHLFTEFLEDFDGRLQRPWRGTIEGVGQGRFTATRDRSFTVVRVAGPARPGPASEGGGSHGDLLCPGVFAVEDDDRVGALRIPAGDYTITLLGGNLTCATAERYFRRFLKRPLGNLPRRWVVLPRSAEFMKFSSHHGFRIKPAA